MNGPLAQINCEETTLPPEPISYIGTFRIEVDGYSVVNEEGVVIVYFDKKYGVKWNVDIEKFDGCSVELIQYPQGGVNIWRLSQPKKGSGDD